MSRDKKSSSLGSWIATILVLVSCFVLAIYNQFNYTFSTAELSWQKVESSVSNYEQVLSRLQKENGGPAQLQVTLKATLAEFTKNHTSFPQTDTISIFDSSVTPISNYFETAVSSSPKLNGIQARFLKSRHRLIESYLIFSEHAALYNDTLDRLPYSLFVKGFKREKIDIYRLKNNFDIMLRSTRKHDK